MFKVKKFDVKDCLGREYFKHAQTYPKSLTKRIYKEGFMTLLCKSSFKGRKERGFLWWFKEPRKSFSNENEIV